MEMHPSAQHYAHLSRDQRRDVLGYVLQARKAADACLTPGQADYGALSQKMTALLQEAALPHQLFGLVDRIWSPAMTLGLMNHDGTRVEPTRWVGSEFVNGRPSKMGLTLVDGEPTRVTPITNPSNARTPRLGRKELVALRDDLRVAEDVLSAPPSEFKRLLANPDVPALAAKVSDERPLYNLQMGLGHKDNRSDIYYRTLNTDVLGDIVRRTFRALRYLQETHPELLVNLYDFAHSAGDIAVLDPQVQETVGTSNIAFKKQLLAACILGNPETGFHQPSGEHEIRAEAPPICEKLAYYTEHQMRSRPR
jgi:hypothetical protein